MSHAVLIVVSSESNNHKALLFVHDGLVDVPSCSQVGENNGTHDEYEVGTSRLVRLRCSLGLERLVGLCYVRCDRGILSTGLVLWFLDGG